MKKIFTLIAVATVSLFIASEAHAQLGVIAGLTSSKVNATEAVKDVKNIVLYHAGLTYKIDLGAGFALQPSAIYQVKGAKLSNIGETSGNQLKTGYVEIPLSIQWGPDLMAFRPYVFAEPFIGYQIANFSKGATFSDVGSDIMNKMEYGFGLGGGLEIASHVQLSVQWFKNLGVIINDDRAKPSNEWWNEVKGVKNFKGIKFSLAILF
ncbi:MAG: PorT family protein [Bacteroidales bacterium]|nr:PorT family protein [Bacteroidales bacterium]